jgi:hypothetical protein
MTHEQSEIQLKTYEFRDSDIYRLLWMIVRAAAFFFARNKKGLGYFPALVLSFPDKNIWHFPPKEFPLHLASIRPQYSPYTWLGI